MSMNISELRVKKPLELVEIAQSIGLENIDNMRKQDLTFNILKAHAKKGEAIVGYSDHKL